MLSEATRANTRPISHSEVAKGGLRLHAPDCPTGESVGKGLAGCLATVSLNDLVVPSGRPERTLVLARSIDLSSPSRTWSAALEAVTSLRSAGHTQAYRRYYLM